MKTICLKPLVLLGALLLFACSSNTQKENKRETTKKKLIELADPTIFYWDNLYYLYGTSGDLNHGFLLFQH